MAAQTPPGPRTLHPLGQMPQLARDPISYMTELVARYGDIVRVRFGPFAATLLNHPEAASHVLQGNHKNYQRFEPSNAQFKKVSGLNLFTSEGAYWLRQRRLIQPGFHREHLRGFADLMTRNAQRAVSAWRSPLEAENAMLELTLQNVAEALFSTSPSQLEGFHKAFALANEGVSYLLTHPLEPDWLPTLRNRQFQTAAQQLRDTVTRLIAQRRAEAPKGDLLDMLLAARYEDTGQPMTDTQVRDESLALLIAGHETSANTLTWALHLLAQHPEVQERARLEAQGAPDGAGQLERLGFTRAVIDEALRLYPSAFMLTRQAIHDDQIMGYRIPGGSVVQLPIWTIHRHKDSWDDPERFDPERFVDARASTRPRYAYLPFGGGPRQCIGNAFALMEMPLILAAILARWRVTQQRPVKLQALTSLRTSEGLWLTLEPTVPMSA